METSAEHLLPIDEVAHLALLTGRVLLQNNADTETVRESITQVASLHGCSAHMIVTYESLLLTLARGDSFRTKTGHHIPAMNVNMGAIAAVTDLLAELRESKIKAAEAAQRLESIEKAPPLYPRWLVDGGLGLTAACLSRLFGGDWSTFFVTWLAGIATLWLRQEIGKRGGNLFLGAFAAACLGGMVGGIAVRSGWSEMAALCFLAPGMILVPGVPLVNGVQDLMKNHITIGLSRLSFAGLLLLAIAGGLFAAAAVTDVRVAVFDTSSLLPAWEDAFFSALATFGFLFLFNVPIRFAWVGIVCAVASHTSRTVCLHYGIDIVTGSLIGALAAGFLANGFAQTFHAPVSAFAFPGVVAMIPGAFAFRAVIGCLHIVKLGALAPLPLIAETLSLLITASLMMLAIAIGVSAPMALFRNKH